MKNYTIELYGWTLDAKAKSINLEQVEQINTLKIDAGAEELSQIKFDIEDTIVPDDTWDILRISKPFWYLDKTIFVVKDTQNIEVNRFELSSVIHHEPRGSTGIPNPCPRSKGLELDCAQERRERLSAMAEVV